MVVPRRFFTRCLFILPVTVQWEVEPLLVFKDLIMWYDTYTVAEIVSTLFAPLCFPWRDSQDKWVVIVPCLSQYRRAGVLALLLELLLPC